jgi:hypothetical protein
VRNAQRVGIVDGIPGFWDALPRPFFGVIEAGDARSEELGSVFSFVRSHGADFSG